MDWLKGCYGRAERDKPGVITYLVGQEETGEETGTPHLQFFIQLKSPHTVGWLQKRFPGLYAAPRKGTVEQCRIYNSKDETRTGEQWDVGVIEQRASKGKRTDIADYIRAIKDGASDVELIEAHGDCFIRYHAIIGKIRTAYREEQQTIRSRDGVQVTVYWGKTGTGKTRKVYEDHPDVFKMPAITKNGTVWADGYEGQKVVLFDDFIGQVPIGDMLHILDRYPHQLQVRHWAGAAKLAFPEGSWLAHCGSFWVRGTPLAFPSSHYLGQRELCQVGSSSNLYHEQHYAR